MKYERVEAARAMAIEAHGNQRYGEKPYIYHLDQVAGLVGAWGNTAEVIAYLHDTLEDTNLSVRTVRDSFGFLVADCVQALTDDSGENRRERKKWTYERLSKIHGESDIAIALVVKSADRLANVTNCVDNGNERLLRMYQGEQEDFRRAVWRKGLNGVMIDAIERLL